MRPGEFLIASLDLSPHPEGGWYRRTWVAAAEHGERPRGSAIYYLLLEGEVSAPHRIDATELWHFYAGDPLELTLERSGAPPQVQIVGPDVGVRAAAPGGGRARGVAVGPATGQVHARRCDGDTGVPLRGLRASQGGLTAWPLDRLV